MPLDAIAAPLALRTGQALQAHQWGVADEVFENLSHIMLNLFLRCVMILGRKATLEFTKGKGSRRSPFVSVS